MSGSLNVGNLYVLLSARTSAFGKAMASAAKTTEKIAKQIKKSAQEIGQVGGLMAAGIGAALAVAAKHNAAVSAEVQRSKDVFATFAGEIASMMLPALKRMNETLREMLGWWQAISPEARAQIAHWVELATVVGLGALAFSKVMGVVTGLAGAFRAIGTVLSVINAPLLLVVAALIGIAVGVALLHRAWRTNWNGMQERVASFVEAISGYWQSFKDWLSNNFFDWFIDKWAAIEKSIARAGNFLKHPLDSQKRADANLQSEGNINAWAAQMKGGAAGAALKVAADKIREGADIVTSEWKLMAKEVGDAMKNALGIKGTPSAGVVASTEAKKRHGLGGHAKLYADQMQGDFSSRRVANTAVFKSGESTREQVAEFWKGMEDLDPIGVQVRTVAYQFKETLKSAFSGIGAALASAARSVTSKLGELGKVIDSAVQGFQSGGWIGAIVAVVMELFSMWEGFQEILDYANGQVMSLIKSLTSGFEGLKEGLMQYMDAHNVLNDVIGGILNPILKIVGNVFKAISPLFEAVAVALGGLIPIFELLDTILGPILEAVGYVLRFVGVTIMATMHALLMLWQGILEIVWNIVKAFSANEGAKVKKMMDDNWSKILGLRTQMQNMWETGSVERGTRAMDDFADAAEKATAALTNMPQGIKVALKQFQATSATSSTDSEREALRRSFIYTGNEVNALPTQSGW